MPKQITLSKKSKVLTNTETEWNDNQREMIAREAYLSAEKRSFNGGDPMQDWLEAESKIREMLSMNT